MSDDAQEENDEPVTLEMIFGMARSLDPGKDDFVFRVHPLALMSFRKLFHRERRHNRFTHGKHTQRARRAK